METGRGANDPTILSLLWGPCRKWNQILDRQILVMQLLSIPSFSAETDWSNSKSQDLTPYWALI